ncbi:serine/threonine-protein kinase [Sphaerisporangium sp. TRM90804]|uniref:serine/threonine-protein kinase n=1 Tax=Sphaerisporangium sp. TRM90804 TaxID=3031113 RepID=UPI00244C740C|nr:serine/threonine-protein kinase [Sphaerisporangium sp. TRM90804]MDH2425480.1 serine/threonine-protein kinase [Sphaerisporangium sp. TRM90804]
MGTPGQLVVKRYRLVRALGQGGMGMVWEGHDTLLDRPVAVKEVLMPPRLDSRRQLDLIHQTSREARTAAKLNHRSIVRVFDVADEDGRPWIIMELVPSRSLDRVIGSEGPLSVARAAVIGSGVLTALSVAHAAGVVHRDVKPANILIGYDGRIVLSDFGIATTLNDPNAHRGGATGSPGFLAPERVQGSPAAPASDLWSLGATLYATVVGRPPFGSGRGPLASLLTLDTEVAKAPAELRPVLAGLLVADPVKRMGAEEAKRLLDAVVTPPAPVTVRMGDAARTKLLAGVAAAVVVAGTVGGWAVLRPSGAAGAEPGASSPFAAPTTAPTTTPTTAAPSPTAGLPPLRWYDAGQGWRARVPRGWRLTKRQGSFTWAASTGTAYLGLQVFDRRGRDALTLLRETETSLSGAVREYRRIRLEKAPGRDTAEWESTWTGPGHHPWAVSGVDYHEVRRVVVSGDRVSVIDFAAVRSEWERLRPTMRAVLKYYRPPAPGG